ncbi:aldehyde dehydrogenase [Brooklawnia cerclae]|uniref:Lactaldehyde dehydrogenase/glycolaldehyde dehydrogenase n=1 Tax=Brooklawnia cerclae TaxID=349934 RepID=A0ABX0SCR0_9ACTN|nr:aldehyde dehydrogenase [Brooklawnia cerclae]NIH56177.1 lactaldehyde dehydrogenase/glycolaldehyde dehydrogenase [Brooklawnia cerclae]
MPELTTYQNYIAGEFRATAETIPVENPATGEVLAYAPRATQTDVDDALQAALEAKKSWALTPAPERASYLTKIAEGIRANEAMLTDVLVKEQSKTPELANVEVLFTADYLDYMAGFALRVEGKVLNSARPKETIFMLRKPLGVAVGILPWNFPFFLIARKLAPALVTGNTCVIKPASVTPINAMEFARIASGVGLPKGVFSMVAGSGAIGEKMAGDPRVDIVSFTGSVPVGSAIMAAASKNVTKVSLELGGKAPAIVLDDADLDLAVRSIKASRVINTGQVCNCAERVYVTRGVADEFISRMTDAIAATKYGDPSSEPGLDMGALINADAVTRIGGMVDASVSQGATVLTGGHAADRGKGYFFQPTVLTDVTQSMPVIQEEVFGPVLPIVVVDDFDEAIEKANDSEYGLTSSLYTTSLANATKGMREIDFGETYINRENFEAMQGFHAGTRKSGVGGADGPLGVEEYTRTQMIYLES